MKPLAHPHTCPKHTHYPSIPIYTHLYPSIPIYTHLYPSIISKNFWERKELSDALFQFVSWSVWNISHCIIIDSPPCRIAQGCMKQDRKIIEVWELEDGWCWKRWMLEDVGSVTPVTCSQQWLTEQLSCFRTDCLQRQSCFRTGSLNRLGS